MRVIKINDKDYVIRYTVNNLIVMEKIVGKPFSEMFGNTGIELTTLRALIYCGLKDHKHDLTEEGAGEFITEALENGFDLGQLSQEFVDELTKSLGFKETPKN